MFNFFKKKKPPTATPPASFAPPSFAQAGRAQYSREQILPRVKHLNFLEALKEVMARCEQAGGDPTAQAPVVRPLVGDLLVSYSFDTPTQFISVSNQAMQELGLTLEELDRIAVENLWQALGENIAIQDLVYLEAVRTGNNLEACALLLPELWNQLANRYQGAPIVAVPDRNTIYSMDSGRSVTVEDSTLSAPQILDLMCDTALRLKADATVHGLSDGIFTWRDGTWHVIGTLDDHAEAL